MASDRHAHNVMAAIEGKRPHELAPLNEGLLASWTRSVTEYGLEPDRIAEPEILTQAELVERRAPSEEITAVASQEIDRLYQRLIDHAQVVMLSDAQGMVMHFRSSSAVIETCSNLRVMPGSVWSEERQGTTGLGLCLREQKPLSVVMHEHFATRLSGLSCTVAPIFGAAGRFSGVLNVTSMRSTDHALQSVVREMVACSARRIENLYFDQRHARGWVLRLSRHNDFCDVAAEARLALDDSGRIIDATPPALRLLAGTACEGGVESLIGRKLSSVVEIGNVERLLHGPAPVIDGRHGRVHVRLVEQAGRSALQRATAVPASRAPRPAAGTRSRPAAPSLEEIVGSDAGMVARLRLAQRLHARSLPLLLQGDSGSGKTQLARSLHEDGPHAAGGFVAINCAAIPAELIESELFGHRAGAFTGAARQGSPGRILGADNGTLFLDEIGDMPLGLQGRLLQVLSEGEFVPIGATAPVKVRFALISATLRDLKTLVQEGRFREDLYYRLSGSTLVLPPLCEREDIAEIIERAFANAALDAGLAECRLSDAARGALIRHRWPGNIRELQHVAKFMVAISDGELIELDCLPAGLLQPADGERRSSLGRAANGRPVSDATALQAHMEQASWNVSAAAARLGISRATLHRRLNEFDVHRPVKPE